MTGKPGVSGNFSVAGKRQCFLGEFSVMGK